MIAARRSLVVQIREVLLRLRFAQNPGLECSPANADANFLIP